MKDLDLDGDQEAGQLNAIGAEELSVKTLADMFDFRGLGDTGSSSRFE